MPPAEGAMLEKNYLWRVYWRLAGVIMLCVVLALGNGCSCKAAPRAEAPVRPIEVATEPLDPPSSTQRVACFRRIRCSSD